MIVAAIVLLALFVVAFALALCVAGKDARP